MTLLGKRVGSIRVIGVLDQGGMGAVYAGFDEKLLRPVALKSIRGDRLDVAARARFLREARSLSQLNHPNICAIYDHIEGTDADFLVLERIQGKSLETAIVQCLDPALRLRIAEQVAETLRFAHSKGIIHRDLKAANIMLTADGTAKVLDFGLAALVGEPAPPKEFHTEIGRLTGTLLSMSPEQARGEPLTEASDMYSFGLLLQELFTGKRSYEPDLPPSLLLVKVREGDTLPVSGVSRDLADLIERLKSPDPLARPTAAEALERLRAIRERPRRRARLLAAAVGALVLVLGTVKYTQDLRRERDAAVRAQHEAERSRQAANRAEPLFLRALAIEERTLGSDHPEVAATLVGLADFYTVEKRYAEAEPLFRRALTIAEKAFPPGHPALARTLRRYARLLRAMGREGEAEALERREEAERQRR
jgi:tRNA A-37 threonylcarbamoyl transferase component Bud32